MGISYILMCLEQVILLQVYTEFRLFFLPSSENNKKEEVKENTVSIYLCQILQADLNFDSVYVTALCLLILQTSVLIDIYFVM